MRLCLDQSKVERLEDIYIKLILLFPLTTLVQSYFDSINRLLFAALVLVQAVLMLIQGRKALSWVLLGVLAVLEVLALFNTGWPLYNLNDMFYLPFMLLYFEYFVTNTRRFASSLQRNLGFIKAVIFIWSGAVLVSVFMPNSYYGKWGSGEYFMSFTDSSFRLAPTALFVLTLVLYVMVAQKKSYIIFSILPMFCFIAGGARTYFGIGAMLFVIVWYKLFDRKKLFWASLIPISIVGIVVISGSSIMDKFLAVLDMDSGFSEFLNRFTNSRSVFWKADLIAFFRLPAVEQLVGKGFNFVYDVNLSAVKTKIWAHNDFLQALTTYGWAGLAIYMVSMIRVLKVASSQGVKKEWPVRVLLIGIWLLNAFFNMFYTYFCSVLSFPVLIIALSAATEGAAKEDKESICMPFRRRIRKASNKKNVIINERHLNEE